MPSPFTRDQLSPEIQARYGLDRAPVGRYVAVLVIVVAFAAALVMTGMFLTRSQVDSKLLTWKVVSPSRVDLTYTVTRPSQVAVTCILRAQDQHRIDLGYAKIDLPAGPAGAPDTTVHEYALATLAPAYTVEVLGCAEGEVSRVPGPQFPPGVVPPDQPATTLSEHD